MHISTHAYKTTVTRQRDVRPFCASHRRHINSSVVHNAAIATTLMSLRHRTQTQTQTLSLSLIYSSKNTLPTPLTTYSSDLYNCTNTHAQVWQAIVQLKCPFYPFFTQRCTLIIMVSFSKKKKSFFDKIS